MMETVGIVPKYPEILRCGFQPCKAPHDIVRVDDPLRIGIHRHTPDAFDRFVIADQRLDEIHIRAVLQHRDIDHFNPQILTDAKMTVIARNRA